MRQNKEGLRGTGKVFSFTFAQLAKNKGNLITAIILLVLSIISVPAGVLLSGGGVSRGETSKISTVYYRDETGYGVDPAETAGNDAYYTGTAFQEADFSPEEFADKGEPASVYVLFSVDALNGGNAITVYRLPDELSLDSEISYLQDTMEEALDGARLNALQVTEEQRDMLLKGTSIQVVDQEEYEAGEQASWEARYGIQLVYAVLVLIVSTFAVTFIVRAVVEEKASKLVEMLLVSVSPLALILGKILAAMAYIFGLVILLAAGMGLSYAVSGRFLDVSAFTDSLAASGISLELLHISPAVLVIVLISMLLGYMTFSIVAGLSGAGCSSTEDIGGASTAATLLILAGYMVSIMIGSLGGSDQVLLFSCLCPILSIFCAPVQYMLGGIGLPVLLLSWVIQAAVVATLAVLCARVYSALLIYRGSRLTFGKILAMAKTTDSGKEGR